MQLFQLELTADEFSTLSKMETAVAAVEICKIHFQRQDPKVTFPASPNRADLHVKFVNRMGFDIEVKGTKESDIAWNQLKVSGRPSYGLLKQGMPLYRVSNIGNRKVTLYVLKYDEDFEMIPEPRWTIKPKR